MKMPFKFNEIDSLDYTTYKNKFNAAIKKLKAKATSSETAVEIFIHQEFNFAEENVQPLILIGKFNGPWKKWVKDSVKANKKMTIIGSGFVEKDDSGSEVFKFARLRGNAKVNKVTKAAKQILNKAKLALTEVESLDKKASSSDDDLINDFGDDVADNDKKNETKPSPQEQAKVLIQEIAATQMDISNNFKSLQVVRKSEAADKTEKALGIIGMVFFLQEEMEQKIETLRELGTADKYVFKFEQNLKMIKEKTSKHEKVKARLESIESTLGSMIADINSKIDQFGAHPEYKIQL